jgi:hypothetical protein
MELFYKQLILLKIYSLLRRFRPFVSIIFLLFEPFIPFFVLLVLRRELKKLEAKGTIDNFHINIVRKSRFNYTVDVRFIITVNQISTLLFDLINKLFRTLKNE